MTKKTFKLLGAIIACIFGLLAGYFTAPLFIEILKLEKLEKMKNFPEIGYTPANLRHLIKQEEIMSIKGKFNYLSVTKDDIEIAEIECQDNTVKAIK